MRLLYLVLLLAGVSAFKFRQPYKMFQVNGYAQGTTYHITYYEKDSLVAKQEIDRLFDKLDSSLSLYKTYSLINQFNSSAGGIRMDVHVKNVVTRSLAIYQDTEGLFDITVRPLVQAWGFGEKNETAIPDSTKVASILSCVGSHLLTLKTDSLVKSKPCVTIDANGIAQGYSVDVVANYLEAKGIQNYLVEVGGEIRVKGKRLTDNLPFTIGIEAAGNDSFDGEEAIQQKIMIGSGAVTTSGIHKKAYTSNRRKISHLIHPLTGFPVDNELVSVTVWAKDAITADGYDNALMGMGLQKALAFTAARKDRLQAFFIYRKKNGTLADTATQGFYTFMVH